MKYLLLIVLFLSCKKETEPPPSFQRLLTGQSFVLREYYAFMPDSTGGGTKCDIWYTLPEELKIGIFPGALFTPSPDERRCQFLNKTYDLVLYDSTRFILSEQQHDTILYSYFIPTIHP